jgi:hypothetical protein
VLLSARLHGSMPVPFKDLVDAPVLGYLMMEVGEGSGCAVIRCT